MNNRRICIRAGTILLFALFSCVSRAQDSATDQGVASPEFRIVRFDEDWSVLRGPALRTEWLDRFKYLPMGPGRHSYLSLGGEVRGTYEHVINDNWTASPQRLNSFGLQRYLFHVNTHVNEQLRVFVQLESGIEQGRPGGPRPIDGKRLDLLNAFVDFRLSKAQHAPTIRIGKQELNFGAGRLVSVREGPNVRQGFLGFRVDQTIGKWQSTGFAVRPSQDKRGFFNDGSNGEVGFWGGDVQRRWNRPERLSLNAYYFGLNQKAATFNRGTAHEVRQTIGTRFTMNPPEKTGDHHVLPQLDLESIYQFGSFGVNSIRAWGLATESSLLFPRVPLSPRIGLRADTSSGDHDATDNTLRTYNPLFPVGEYFGIFADTGPGPSNFRDLHPALILSPHREVGITVDDVVWWRASLHDGVYDVPGHLLVPAGSSTARFVGHRPGVEVRWQVDRHTSLRADYGIFFAGPFLRESGNAKNLNYTLLLLDYKF